MFRLGSLHRLFTRAHRFSELEIRVRERRKHPGGSLRGTRFACPPGFHVGPYGHRCWRNWWVCTCRKIAGFPAIAACCSNVAK
jgi:hypothetical protein